MVDPDNARVPEKTPLTQPPRREVADNKDGLLSLSFFASSHAEASRPQDVPSSLSLTLLGTPPRFPGPMKGKQELIYSGCVDPLMLLPGAEVCVWSFLPSL